MSELVLKRGQSQNIDLGITNDSGTIQNFNSGYTATCVFRKRAGKADEYFTGDQIDSLTSAAGRITFTYVDANSLYNVRLSWNTAQATALPNTDVEIAGDVKIFNSSNECVESVRVELDLKHEVT